VRAQSQRQSAAATALREPVRDVISALFEYQLAEGEDEQSLAQLIPDRYDSLGVLDAVGAVETGFGVVIDLVEDDLKSTFYSVATIAALVARKQHDAAVLEGLL
jgi:acyl carrier protein